jgi:eukaryotic-like serine/threonine-protein kinase
VTRTGLTLGERYRLDKRIAAGGVGQVWQATDLLLSRPVAVKVLRPEYADHPETLERFRKEARHAGALSHPHVAQVFDYGPAGPDWPPYLVMEFVDGPSLADILVVDPVEPAFALDVIAQAADGLSAAHRAGLVHRDVKPGNLLIGPEGLVKVTDFGIAHAAGQAPVTGPNLVMGTTQYMAPERIAGGPGTPASDLYALGIVLHECLTGIPPFEGAPADVMAAHLYLPLPPLPADVPPELDDLVARLTAKDPAARMSDARELAKVAAGLRDAVASGRLVPSARAAMLSGPATSAVAAGPAEPAVDDSLGSPASGQRAAGLLSTAQFGAVQSGTAGAGTGRGGATAVSDVFSPADSAQVSDEWAVPARMSAPASPPGLGGAGGTGGRRGGRGRRGAALAVLAAVLAGGVLVALLVSGALRDSPTANPVPAGTPTSGAPTPGGRASHPVSRVSQPAGGVTGPSTTPTAGATSPSPAGSRKPSPAPSASTSASPSSSPSPSQSASGSPSDSPTGSPSDSPTGNPSDSPTTSPSPTPSGTATQPCLLGVVCL